MRERKLRVKREIMNVPPGTVISMTYWGGNRRGIKLEYKHQEVYLPMPRDLFRPDLFK